jgi:hypothetical protein
MFRFNVKLSRLLGAVEFHIQSHKKGQAILF